MIEAATESTGVYALYRQQEVLYIGWAKNVKEALFAHLLGSVRSLRAITHYWWDICDDCEARANELLAEHQERHGRLPPMNDPESLSRADI